MKCTKCGKEFSESVISFHIERCEKSKEVVGSKSKKKEKTPQE